MRKKEIKIVAEALAYLAEYNSNAAEEYLADLVETAPTLTDAYRSELLLSHEFALTDEIFNDLMAKKFGNQWCLFNKSELGNTEDVWCEAAQQAQAAITGAIKQK